MKAHEKFVNELRASVKKYDQEMKERPKTKDPHPFDTLLEEDMDIQQFFEKRFNELFSNNPDD